MRFEGQITQEVGHYVNPALIVDAEPHVMQRIRKLFDNASNTWERGKFSHKPIKFPSTMAACRDLIWLLDRYTLEVAPELLKSIQEKADQYDQILANVANADQDGSYRISKDALKLALPLRDHQIKFNNMFSKMKRMLLADTMGLGKTPSGISVLCEPERRPALIIVPPNLCTQWEREVKRFLPDASTHVIRGFKNYDLPKVDVLITSYNRIGPWQDVLFTEEYKFKTIIMDEVHELRHTSTAKRHHCFQLAENVEYCLGMSGTPIFNMGDEIYSVLDVIKPGCLGSKDEFESEWCNWGKVHEPATLNHFLKQQGLFLRRTPEQVGLKFGEASKHVYTIDSDLEKLKEVQNVAKLLALSVLSGNVGEDSDSAREFDWKLRHATGVAKAKPVAEFVKMLVEQGEKVVLAGWHRDVYDVWMKELAHCNPVMYTGSESIKEKDAAVKKFVEGNAQVFIISLRSGAGLDGLQRACNTLVFGELDWSPHVMDQVVARLDRDGQARHVNAYYLNIADGADPFMISVLSDKRSQHDGLVEGKQSEGLALATPASKDRVKEMAASYLKSIGEEVPEPVPEEGFLGDLAALLRRTRLPNNTEEEMQEALAQILQEHVKDLVQREYKFSKRSRIDFLISRGDERIAIECKINQTGRPEVYRQVRRYVEEGNVKALILMAPWNGIPSFRVEGTPVIVIDTSINSI